MAGAPATAASHDADPFVFHDASGRRWSRIKRLAFLVAAALVVAGGGVALAVYRVAPGRAPVFSSTAPQQVPDWPARDSGGTPAPAPSAAAGPVAPLAVAKPTPAPRATPTVRPTATHAPTPTLRPTPTPKRTRLPF